MKRETKHGDEYDAFSPWRRVIVWGRGETKGIKQRVNRRERRQERQRDRRGD